MLACSGPDIAGRAKLEYARKQDRACAGGERSAKTHVGLSGGKSEVPEEASAIASGAESETDGRRDGRPAREQLPQALWKEVELYLREQRLAEGGSQRTSTHCMYSKSNRYLYVAEPRRTQ